MSYLSLFCFRFDCVYFWFASDGCLLVFNCCWFWGYLGVVWLVWTCFCFYCLCMFVLFLVWRVGVVLCDGFGIRGIFDVLGYLV